MLLSASLENTKELKQKSCFVKKKEIRYKKKKISWKGKWKQEMLEFDSIELSK